MGSHPKWCDGQAWALGQLWRPHEHVMRHIRGRIEAGLRLGAEDQPLCALHIRQVSVSACERTDQSGGDSNRLISHTILSLPTPPHPTAFSPVLDRVTKALPPCLLPPTGRQGVWRSQRNRARRRVSLPLSAGRHRAVVPDDLPPLRRPGRCGGQGKRHLIHPEEARRGGCWLRSQACQAGI